MNERSLLHRLAAVTWLATFVLLIAGGMVTSTGSGLATTDPVRIDGFSGTKLFEHGHRVIGWTVGFLTLLTALTAVFREKSAPLRRLTIFALAAVALQGTLGMLTVRYELKLPAISIAHAGLAQITFALLTAAVALSSPGWTKPAPDARARVALVTVFLQILAGAWYRHTNTSYALAAHLLMVLAVAAAVFRVPDARFLGALFLVQMFLGPAALTLTKGKIIADVPEPLSRAIPITAHVAVGALMIAAATWRNLRQTRLSPEPQPSWGASTP